MAKTLPKFGIGIDWETTGSTWGGDSSILHQGISLGAAIFDLQTFDVIETMYVEIKFNADKYIWTDGAEKIHGLSREHLEKNGVTREEAAVELLNMMVKYIDMDKDVMVLGHNVDFDIKFTKQLLEPFELMFKVSHRHLDTSGMGLILLNAWNSNELFDILGLPERKLHNALEDILMTIEAAKRMKLLVTSVLA